MARPSQMLLRLDVETQAYHRDVDQPWLDLLVPELTRPAYVEQLGRAYTFEAPLEAALAYTPHLAALVGTRSRSRLLARDLFALDVAAGKLAPRLIAPFPSAAEALGWLYVLERGAFLLERVKRNVAVRLPNAPITYVDDTDAASRWEELGAILDGVARSARVSDQIVHAAHDGFRCLVDWYVSDQPLRRGA